MKKFQEIQQLALQQLSKDAQKAIKGGAVDASSFIGVIDDIVG